MLQRENIIDRLVKMSDAQKVAWAQDNEFVPRYMQCIHCQQFMVLIKSLHSVDGFCWQCRNYTCSKYQTRKHLRKGGCFETFSTDIVTLAKLMYFWSQNLQQNEILKLTNVSRSLVYKFESFVYKQLAKYFEINPIMLGGPNRICQIDETMLNFKVKSHVGRGPRDKIWCFGIVDTTFVPALGYVCVVPNRTANTLLPIITRVVRPGTIIVSDEWPGYNKIEIITGLDHFRVCHKENFVCTETGMHTQNIESYWNKIKIIIKKMKGVLPCKHNDLLNAFMWKERSVGYEWQRMVDLIKL